MEIMSNEKVYEMALQIGFEVAIFNEKECILFNRETNAIMYLDFTSKYFQTPYVIVPRVNKDKIDVVYYLFDDGILCKLKREIKTDWPTLNFNNFNYFVSDLEKQEFKNNGTGVKTKIFTLITFNKIVKSGALQDVFGDKNKTLLKNINMQKATI